jgi:hypothetical protein
MYKKMILIISIVLFSGCTDIANQLSNAVVDGIKAGLAGKKSTKSTLNQRITDDEDKEKAMEQCLREQESFFNSAGLTRKEKIKACDEITSKNGFKTLAQIKLEEKNAKKSDSQKESEMKTCHDKFVKYMGDGTDSVCKHYIEASPVQQCMFEYKMKGVSQSTAFRRCSN